MGLLHVEIEQKYLQHATGCLNLATDNTMSFDDKGMKLLVKDVDNFIFCNVRIKKEIFSNYLLEGENHVCEMNLKDFMYKINKKLLGSDTVIIDRKSEELLEISKMSKNMRIDESLPIRHPKEIYQFEDQKFNELVTLSRVDFNNIMAEFNKKNFDKVKITIDSKNIRFESVTSDVKKEYIKMELKTNVIQDKIEEKSGIFWVSYLKEFSKIKTLGKSITICLLLPEKDVQILILKYDLSLNKNSNDYGTCIYSVGNAIGERILVKKRLKKKRGIQSGVS